MGNLGRWVLVASCSVALFAAGCGDDEDSGSSDSSSASTSAADSGGEIKVEKKTIGFLDIALSSPVGRATEAAVKAAGDELGWEVITEDGEANPETMSRAASSFVTRNVDAVILGSVEAAAIAAPLRQLDAKDIPVIGVNAQVAPSPLIDFQYTESEDELARTLAEHIVEVNPEAKIGNIKSTLSIAGTERDKTLKDVVDASGTAKILGDVEPDFASLVPSTTKGVTDMLTAHPDIDTVWSVFDNFLEPTIAAMRSKKSDAKLYTFYLTPTSFDLLSDEKSPLDAIVDANLDHTGVVAMDQLVHHFENGTELDPDAIKKDPVKYTVVTRDNLPASLDDESKTEAALAPFREKWQKEFGG